MLLALACARAKLPVREKIWNRVKPESSSEISISRMLDSADLIFAWVVDMFEIVE